MASETEYPELSSLIERLIRSRNRDLATFLPFLLALTSNLVVDSSSPDQETGENTPSLFGSSDRIILMNPVTQGMVVIGGSTNGGGSSSPSSLEALLGDLFGKDGPPPASKASMEAMPVVEIDEHSEGECVICLEEWGEVGGVAKEMPCKHRFHGECIEKWLSVHGTCPVCRYKMPVEENSEKNRKIGENGGRRRHIWISFGYRDDRSSQESNEENGTSDSSDSSSSSPSQDS